MANESHMPNSKRGQIYNDANYEADKIIQKVIKVVKEIYTPVISRLPPSWGELRGLLYMNQRLVILKEMREKVLRAIDYGHTGRDAVFREASDICLHKHIAR